MEKTITIKEFYEEVSKNGGSYEVLTPDGFKEIGNIYKKNNKQKFKVIFDDCYLIGSSDHLLEVFTYNMDYDNINENIEILDSSTWLRMCNLTLNDPIYTKNGIKKPLKIKKLDIGTTYDLEVLDENHKYYTNNIVSHNTGKTALAEALAQRLVSGDVPENLKTKEIISLDMGSLVANAVYKGEFEDRLKNVVKEITESNGDKILFIDEVHTLIGTGGGQGSMDAANILKPALSRGQLRTIGATTTEEFKIHFEKDKALVRRFQPVLCDEPDVVSTISILRGIKEKYEQHHKVRIMDSAIVSAAELSHRYISDRFLPDKAIDLVDEACSKLRLEMNSVPEEIDEVQRKIQQLEIEKVALEREKDTVKVEEINNSLLKLKEQIKNFNVKWDKEKILVDKIQEIKMDLENLSFTYKKLEDEGNFNDLAILKYETIPNKEKELEKLQIELKSTQGDSKLINEEVSAEDIADVVSKWTGIPVSKMLESEREKLIKLEDVLHKRIIGQEEGIEIISDAVRRSRIGLQDPTKPMASFMMLGPSGVGKTETVKALADYLFNDEHAIIRIDMSEYMEKHSVSRLTGPPPGYIGYDEGGQLTDAVRRKPYSIVLLDEIEKAHPDVFNILLQVLDDGRLTDNKGRVVDFKNTIIMMTSNMGSEIIQRNFLKVIDDSDYDEIFEQTNIEILDMLKSNIRPEFLNRIDEIITYKPLSKEEICKIVDIQFKSVQDKLTDYKLTLSDNAKSKLSELSYQPEFGARPVKRTIQKMITNKLSKEIIKNSIKINSNIYIDYKDDFVFNG